MTKPILHPLSQEGDWCQYRTMDSAQEAHDIAIRRLIRSGDIEDDDPITRCGKGICGLGSKIPPFREKSPNPFPCSAACRLAQIRLERRETRRFARILKKVDDSPLSATVVSPKYWREIPDLPDYNVNGLVQSIKRRLKQAEGTSERRLVAVGRVDFDLGVMDDWKVVVRPHVHLVVAGCPEGQILTTYLRQRFSREDYPNFKPVVVKPVHDRGALRYALKCKLGGLPNQGGEALVGRQARGRPPAAALIAFEQFLSRYRVSDLLVLYGIRINGSSIEVLNDETRSIRNIRE